MVRRYTDFIVSSPGARFSLGLMSLQIHNTLTRRVEPFAPLEPGHVRMYVCGMTIYDLCHMGHARMMMAFDVVYRWLRTLGYRVTYVRNITDIEDKIINRALERGITIRALTDEMIAAMRQDLGAIGTAPPTHEPRATDYVPQMLSMIGTLENKGLAYRAANGDVNFAVRKFPGYGKLSGKSIDDLRAGERVAVGESKDDPLDFVLWKAAKPTEPADASYAERLRPGAPGLAHRVLGDELRAARRACSTSTAAAWTCSSRTTRTRSRRAKARSASRSCATGCTTAFSTSERAETTRRCRSRWATSSPSATCSSATTARRCAFSCCARTTAARSTSATPTSTTRAPRWHACTRRCSRCRRWRAPLDWSAKAPAAFRAAMNDDFNTPAALAVLFELAGEANRTRDHAASTQIKQLGGHAGFSAAGATGLAARRRDARRCDRSRRASLRARKPSATRTSSRPIASATSLIAHGIVLKDSAQGTTWVRA